MYKPNNTNTILLIILILISATILFFQVTKKSTVSIPNDVQKEFGQDGNTMPVHNTSVPTTTETGTPNTVQSGEGTNFATLDMSSEVAKRYKTKLTEALAQPANFYGHYVLSTIECGTDCYKVFILDKNTGKVFFTSLNGKDNWMHPELDPNVTISSNSFYWGIGEYKFNGKELIELPILPDGGY